MVGHYLLSRRVHWNGLALPVNILSWFGIAIRLWLVVLPALCLPIYLRYPRDNICSDSHLTLYCLNSAAMPCGLLYEHSMSGALYLAKCNFNSQFTPECLPDNPTPGNWTNNSLKKHSSCH